MFSLGKKTVLPSADEALAGRSAAIMEPGNHFVSGLSLAAPYPAGSETAMFGLGCFWGAERVFWRLPGVLVTAVGYSAGFTPNPTYKEVCSGATGHNEVVLVVFDPSQVSFAQLLATFWQAHNPTQGMMQGNDRGTQYRSGIYCFNPTQTSAAKISQQQFQTVLNATGANTDAITTEIIPASPFFFAEDYHQQYLAKDPNGYCGLGGLGVSFPSDKL